MPSPFGPMLGPVFYTGHDGFTTGSATHISSSGREHGGSGRTFLAPGNPFADYAYPHPGFTNLFFQDLGYLYDKLNDPNQIEDLRDAAKEVLGDTGLIPGDDTPTDDPKPPVIYPSPSAHQIDYLYADLAKHYGMNQTTAYNEAMANTAYQRAVADMQMAGLNPASLFSASRASVAGSGFASSTSSGGFSSARGAASGDTLPGWIYYGLPALTQAVVTGVTKNVSYGFVASQVAQNFLKAYNGK